MKDSFVLYTEYEEHLSLLTMEQRGVLITAIFCFQSNKALPKMDSSTYMAFSFIKKQLERDNAKYEEVCRKRQEAGKLGGRPKAKGLDEKAKKANGFSEKQTKAKKPVYEYEYDNVNEDENENVNNDDKDTKNTSGIVGTKSNKKFIAPSIDEVRAYAVERGREDLVERFYKYYSASEWKDKSGKKVKNWKLKFVTWENNNPKPQSTTPFARQSQPQVDGSLYKVL